jgi:hypothetical protein
MNIRERILLYLDFKGISKYKFYKQTGLSNGFLDKDGAIGSDKCEIICSFYSDLNPEWLLIGEGSMIKSINVEIKEKRDVRIENQVQSVNILLDKIVELTTENTILKVENDELKRTTQNNSYKESDIPRSVAAEPED